jgi:hypothetical protein
LAVPDKFNLKYVFSNDQFYDPLLFFYGWHRVQYLEAGIAIWEREDIPVLPEVLPRREIPSYQRIMFGTLPPLALLSALLVTTAHFWLLPLRLLAELLGIRLPRRTRPALPLHRIWKGMDRRLLAASSLPEGDDEAGPPWQIWLQSWLRRTGKRLDPASVQARHLRTAALGLLLCILLIGGIAGWLAYQRSPQQVILAYYDDLDFRRFERAYRRLDPRTRPDFEQYMLNLSVQGGLVASYAKLEDLEMAVVVDAPNYKELQVDARYITALSYYTDTKRLALHRIPGDGWVIEPDVADLAVPPDQFLRRTEVTFLSQERRRATSATTSFADVLDRPELAILSADLVVDDDGRFSLVGEVMNSDADPADLTVTGQIYDSEGQLLTWYNAGAAMIHKALPLEIVPFRIDFEGVAGAALEEMAIPLSFTPEAAWNYQLPQQSRLGSFTLFARAVVTARDLDRDLGVQQVRVIEDAAGLRLQGALINAGLVEAVIPHILITLYDHNGEVRWVDHYFLRQSVRPQRTLAFDLAITPANDIHSQNLDGEFYVNGLRDEPLPAAVRADFIPLPPGHGYAYARISVNYFTGGGR